MFISTEDSLDVGKQGQLIQSTKDSLHVGKGQFVWKQIYKLGLINQYASRDKIVQM